MTTTNLATIAQTAATRFDMDLDAAETAARTYLAQIEALDQQDHDEDALSPAVADFIIESIRQTQDEQTITPLDWVAETAERVADAEADLAAAKWQRDTAVLDAIKAGAPIRQIAFAAGLARQSIYGIQERSQR